VQLIDFGLISVNILAIMEGLRKTMTNHSITMMCAVLTTETTNIIAFLVVRSCDLLKKYPTTYLNYRLRCQDVNMGSFEYKAGDANNSTANYGFCVSFNMPGIINV
jgi:hypothetical protein